METPITQAIYADVKEIPFLFNFKSKNKNI
jgi:hypothetical protein